ncbi:MAG: hypothetical protein E7062_02655 [Spirochaetaceae bacterium]|nr:hypothetical protein [Spirochaetaceae bacterium]
MIKIFLLCFSLFFIGCSEKSEEQFSLASTDNLLKNSLEGEIFSIEWTTNLDEKKTVAKQKKGVVRYPEGLFILTENSEPVYPEIEDFAVFNFSGIKDSTLLDFVNSFVNRIMEKDFPADVLSRDFLHTKIFFTDYLTKLPIITEYFIGEPKIFEDYWEFPLYFFYETHKKSQGVIQIKKDNDSFVVDFFQLGQLYE